MGECNLDLPTNSVLGLSLAANNRKPKIRVKIEMYFCDDISVS